MITITEQKIKCFSQQSYDEMIEELPFHKLSCTCGRRSDLVRHGRYNRFVKVSARMESIKVLRVLCKSCGKTHALLPEWIVPFSSVLLKDHIEIIKTHLSGESIKPVMAENPMIDESNIRYIVKQFRRHWLQRLATCRISLDKHIIHACFQTFSRQFMQIKCTPNLLFS
jgi:hypothetical protein